MFIHSKESSVSPSLTHTYSGKFVTICPVLSSRLSDGCLGSGAQLGDARRCVVVTGATRHCYSAEFSGHDDTLVGRSAGDAGRMHLYTVCAGGDVLQVYSGARPARALSVRVCQCAPRCGSEMLCGSLPRSAAAHVSRLRGWLRLVCRPPCQRAGCGSMGA